MRSLAERDLRELSETKLSSDQLRRLLLIVAHHHGQASMLESIQDLGLKRVFVIYPGERRYELDEKIEVLPLGSIGTIAGYFE